MFNFIPPKWMSKRHLWLCFCSIFFVILSVVLLNFGAGANKTVTTFNHGLMPVVRENTYMTRPDLYTNATGETKLNFLGDRYKEVIPYVRKDPVTDTFWNGVDFITGNTGPGVYYFSIGDACIWSGTILLPLSLAVFLPTFVQVLKKEREYRRAQSK